MEEAATDGCLGGGEEQVRLFRLLRASLYIWWAEYRCRIDKNPNLVCELLEGYYVCCMTFISFQNLKYLLLDR